MRKAAWGDAAGAEHSRAADRPNIPYLRARPPFRRFEKQRQQANHEALAQLERYLAALSWYRHCLENPTVHRA